MIGAVEIFRNTRSAKSHQRCSGIGAAGIAGRRTSMGPSDRTRQGGQWRPFRNSYTESGYEQHCLGTPNSGRSYARRAHASRSCPRSGMSPSVSSILGEQGQQPADQCRLYARLHRTGAQSTWRNSVFDTDTRSPIALIEFHYLPLIGNLPLSDNSIHNYQESFDGRGRAETRSIDIRTLQQSRAKAAPHVFGCL